MLRFSGLAFREVLSIVSAIALGSCAAHAEVELETTFDSSVEFFSAFDDYAVGTHIYDPTTPTTWSEKGIFANKVKGAYYAKVGCKGTGGLYVMEDAPGKYIYSSLSATRPMAANPRGIRHDYNGGSNATYMYLNGMGTPLGTADGHTVELFFKLDRSYSGSPIMFYYDPYKGNNENRVVLYLQTGSPAKLRFDNCGSAAPTGDDGNKYKVLTYGDLATFVNDGHWHHVAVVYKAEWGGVKLYCDYTLVSGIVKVDISANTAQMRIGDNGNGFPGLTSAARVSTVALEPKDFMRASNHANGPDPDVEFFSAFNDYPVGTHISDETSPTTWTVKGRFLNQAKDAYHAQVQCKGAGGVYVVEDAPGKYIYSSLSATRPMAVDPRGIRHEGDDNGNATFMQLNSLSQPLALAAGHTVELFFKVDRAYSGNSRLAFFYDPYPGDNKQRPIVWLLPGGQRIRVQNNGSEAPAEPKYQDYTYDGPYLNDGHWHHVAIVYKAEWQGIKLYCDYALASDVIKVNVKDCSNQLRIGNNANCFPGLTSAFRVTGVALGPEDFMRASNSSCGPEQNEDNYLFPFNEEEVGTIYRNDEPDVSKQYESKFKGYNARGNLKVQIYVKGTGTGEICADSPGNYLYSDVYSKVPVATGVKSYRQHNPDLSSNVNSSFLQLIGGSHRMARYGSHTVEFFWKSETFPFALDMAYWDLVKETTANGRRYALQMATSSTAEYIKLWPALLRGEDVPAASDVCIPYEGYKTSSGAQTGLADGLWHHTAVVFDAATGSAQLYCDYALTSETKVPIGDLSGLALPDVGCEMRYGSYKWDSYLSAVRISKGKLTPDRFLYASDSPDGALPKAGVAWRLDGTAGARIADTNAAAAAKQYVYTIAAGARGDAVATGSAVYSDDFLAGSRYVGETHGTRNRGSAALASDALLRSSGLGPLVSSASAFTVQAMVKANAHPASGEALLLAQADQTNGFAWALVERADGKLAFKAKVIDFDGLATDWELVSTAVLPLGSWHYVAVSCDKESGAVKLYLDHQEIAKNDSTDGQLLLGDGGLVSGAVGSFSAVDGLVDEIVFSREILSASQLTEIKCYGFIMTVR